MRKKLGLFSSIFVVLLLFSGCKTSTTTPSAPIQISPLTHSPLPTTTQMPTKLTATLEPVLELPVPEGDVATVGGTLLLEEAGKLRPLVGARIYLAEVHMATDNVNRIAGYSEETSPKMITNATGQFVIENVPPDTYSFVVVRYMDPLFMRDHETGESIIFTVEAGDVLDLGEIHYPADIDS